MNQYGGCSELKGFKNLIDCFQNSLELSYPINNFVEATYVYVIFESNPKSINVLNKWTSDDPSVLRSLVIKLTPAELKFREDNILNQVASN